MVRIKRAQAGAKCEKPTKRREDNKTFGVIKQDRQWGHQSVGKKYSPPLWHQSIPQEKQQGTNKKKQSKDISCSTGPAPLHRPPTRVALPSSKASKNHLCTVSAWNMMSLHGGWKTCEMIIGKKPV
mmetsp:Transcript_24800/g.40343  ORF Transcript_24800/g.40343 Transcript_24800/m.40343 type:complete len:126 (-) Transcript_24800:47-424(-)